MGVRGRFPATSRVPTPVRGDAYQDGQDIGDFLALIMALEESGLGAAGRAGGEIAMRLPNGQLVGVPVTALSAVLVSHGTLTATIASTHLSVNAMNQEIRKGKAPSQVKRVDRGKVKNEQDHVHFNGKKDSALNQDGTWKHGFAKLFNDTIEWLEKHGWTIP